MITAADAQQLEIQLQRNATGAHAHTAGKAQFYLKKIADKPNAGFSNCSADEFVQHVKNALYKGEWKQLGDLMGRWW